jgi:glycerol-3-phosphate acyltransferase PlsY
MTGTALYFLGGFLLGSVPFGYVLVRLISGQDVRAAGSGNIGATNVGRVLGRGGWLATLLLDGGKGAMAVLIAQAVAPDPAATAAGAVAGLGAILGHCYSPWMSFRGGKGVATMLGTFAVLAPAATLVAIVVFLLVAALTRYVSAASLAAAVALAAFTFWRGVDPALQLAAAVTLAVVMVRHRANIGRLTRGEEARIGSRT